MSEGDVDIRVGAPGAKQAAKDLQEVAKASEQVGHKGRSGGEAASEGFSRTGAAVGQATDKVKALVTALLGISTARQGLAEIKKDMDAISESSERATRAQRGVMAMTMATGERPEVQKYLWDLAAMTGRDMTEVAPAYYTLRGGTFGMTEERRRGLMNQAALMLKTDKSARFDPLVNLMSTIGTQQGALTDRQIGNLLSQGIESAKSTPGEMAAYLPQIFTAGGVGGVDPATLTAMFSFATRRGGGVAKSGTAVTAAMLGLLAPSPDTAKALAEYGYDQASPLMERISWLGREGGRMPPEILAALGGRRGLQAISAISRDPAAFRAEVGTMGAALAAKGSLMEARLGAMFGELPGQRYLEELDAAKVVEERMKQQPGQLKSDVEIRLYELLMRARGVNAADRWLGGSSARWKRAVGLDPFLGRGLSDAERAYLSLAGEDYTVQQLVDAFGPIEMELSEGEYRGVTAKTFVRGLLYQRGVKPNPTYQGGTHFHGTYEDPAGEAVPQRAD